MKHPIAISIYESNETFLDENLLVSGPTQKAMIVYIPANTAKKYPTKLLSILIEVRWVVRKGSIKVEKTRANITVTRQKSARLMRRIVPNVTCFYI